MQTRQLSRARAPALRRNHPPGGKLTRGRRRPSTEARLALETALHGLWERHGGKRLLRALSRQAQLDTAAASSAGDAADPHAGPAYESLAGFFEKLAPTLG